MSEKKVIIGRMRQREAREWKGATTANRNKRRKTRRLHGSNALFAAAVLCVCGSAAVVAVQNGVTQAVMSHLTAGFEYDETLGRLQFVSSVLPESAMVFLTSETDEPAWVLPSEGEITHAWSQSEPWLEYDAAGTVSCCEAGEVMTVIKNREDEYTVRVLHSGGYESLYSGLTVVTLAAGDLVNAGEAIGTAGESASFELRRDGLSILPVFGGESL